MIETWKVGFASHYSTNKTFQEYLIAGKVLRP